MQAVRGRSIKRYEKLLMVQPLRKIVWRYFRKLNIEPPYDLAIPLLGIYPDKSYLEKAT